MSGFWSKASRHPHPNECNVIQLDGIIKQSYIDRNGDASIQAHLFMQNHEQGEEHQNSGNYIKSGVFGGLDGIITTFGTISLLSGTRSSPLSILIIGLANLVADSLSMGIGDYLSERSEYSFISSEYKREKWEYDNFLEGEKREMVAIYQKRGMDPVDAQRAVDILSRRKEHFIDVMMVEELGVMPPNPNESHLLKGFITFLSFLAFGALPLLPYVITTIFGINIGTSLFNWNFVISASLTLFTLFTLGALSSKLTSGRWIRNGLWITATGGLASVLAFALAYFLSRLMELDMANY